MPGFNPRVGAAAGRAIRKAASLRGAVQVEYTALLHEWHIPSASGSGEVYTVRPYSYQPERCPWWDRYFCTCAAADAGLAVCWHKAYVKLMVDEQLEKGGRGSS